MEIGKEKEGGQTGGREVKEEERDVVWGEGLARMRGHLGRSWRARVRAREDGERRVTYKTGARAQLPCASCASDEVLYPTGIVKTCRSLMFPFLAAMSSNERLCLCPAIISRLWAVL
eukprot:6187771-Pleurochrysis_carterae.AAC.3